MFFSIAFFIVDKTKFSTFNNLTLPTDVSDEYLPKKHRYEEKRISSINQLKYQTENFVVLVKVGRTKNREDVKMTIHTPETKFKVIDITIFSNEDDQPKITTNDNEIKIDKKKNYDYHDGYIRIYRICHLKFTTLC